MFGNLGVHILKCPSGCYSFVGSLPVSLAEVVPATKADVLGCRAFFAEDGSLKAYKFPTFTTADEARAYAAARDVTVVEGDA